METTPSQLGALVGIPTRDRAGPLGRALDSLGRQTPPKGGLGVLVVENSDTPTSEPVVAAFRARTGLPVWYVLEPEPGYASVRNRILTEAEAIGAPFLAMLDDDEVAEPDWIVNMLSEMRRRDLDFAGGPNLLEAEEAELDSQARAVLERFQSAHADLNHARLQAARDGGPVEIYTNNWCIRLPALLASGLRFDPRLNRTGGEDTHFSREASEAGLTLGWVGAAVTTDVWPTARLQPAYLFRRQFGIWSNGVNSSRFTTRAHLRRLRRDGLRILRDTAFLVHDTDRRYARLCETAGRFAGRVHWLILRRPKLDDAGGSIAPPSDRQSSVRVGPERRGPRPRG